MATPARQVMLIVSGRPYDQAAVAIGRRSYQSISKLVTRCNRISQRIVVSSM